MDFTPAQWAQLIGALALGVVFFTGSYVARAKVPIALLVVLAPFQIIASPYGTLNIVLIYLVGAAHLLRGRITRLPFIGFFVIIFLAYLLSMSQAPPPTYLDHALYLVGVGANIVFFYLVYNYVRGPGYSRAPINMLLFMNVLVLVYCVVQLITGVERFAFLGVPEFAFAEISEQKERLVGPFGAAGTNAEFFVLQTLLVGYLALHERRLKWRYFLIGLALTDFGLLIMTGSRGSFLTMIGAGALFLWFFRGQLGLRRIARVAVVSSMLFAATAAVAVNFTQFNVLFDRLAGTELRGGLPDTRALSFRLAWERIPENLILGHGPQLRLINEQSRRIEGYHTLYYPHNLYLYLTVTVGLVGLLAYLLFFYAMYRWWRRSRRAPIGSRFEDGLPTLAILLLIAFLVDQLKIEFLRSRLSDHQQYMFALWAILLALTATPKGHISAGGSEPRARTALTAASGGTPGVSGNDSALS